MNLSDPMEDKPISKSGHERLTINSMGKVVSLLDDSCVYLEKKITSLLLELSASQKIF